MERLYPQLSNTLSFSTATTSPPLDSMLNGRPHFDAPSPAPEHRDSSSGPDPYRAVILLLLAASILGAIGAFVASQMIGNPVLADVAVTFGIAIGVLIGVAVAHDARERKPGTQPDIDDERGPAPSIVQEAESLAQAPLETPAPPPWVDWRTHLTKGRGWLEHQAREHGVARIISVATAAAGVLAIALELFYGSGMELLSPLVAGIGAAVCLAAAGLAACVAHYLRGVDSSRLPESPGLCHGARAMAWILVFAGVSMGLAWAGFETILQILHYLLIAINFSACYSLFWTKPLKEEAVQTFPLQIEILSILGSRPNIVASILETAEQQLGIDLRSTWALTVVRRSVEPLVIGLFLLAWASTSLTVVGMQEEGLVERLGVAVGGQPLQPGLHLHWPWPIDRVFRIPVRLIQATNVGHEGQEEAGPEDVLWAVEHAPNEYTLLLGNGRDLITIDAGVQYRIRDARAWRYHTQNPADAIKAIAYRAVMRSTVNRTLSEALSENVVTLTGHMREMVQQDVDALGLGVDILAFTVGGMHPPVPVAADYQAVVSAEIAKVTAVVNAQAYHNEVVPSAEAAVVKGENGARAEGVNALARAAGEAWSFRTLESQYRAAPQEYFFRRRLETLEKGLTGRSFTVVDSRFQRDGGELWLIP